MASSAHKLIPSDPEKVMVIRNVTPDIITMSTPFLRMGRIKIGGRGTLVRLATGNVAVFSPVALTESAKKQTDALGQVKYLVASDQEHHIFLETWHKAYPDAKILAPDTLPAYREKQKYPKLPQNLWLLFPGDKPTPSVSEEFDREFDVEYVTSHANKEIVVNHRPSRTVIQADLLFNLPATEQFSKTDVSATSGILTRIMGIVGTTQGSAIWQKRFLWYAASASDRPAFNESMKRIASWDFDKIVPCHGDVIESGGKGIFEKVFEWHLKAVKKGN